jgi:hypothetical protein
MRESILGRFKEDEIPPSVRFICIKRECTAYLQNPKPNEWDECAFFAQYDIFKVPYKVVKPASN